MFEGRRVVAGEAILNDVATSGRSELGHGEKSRELAAARNDLDALVREHSRLVYRIAYAVLRGHHDAEDATQETFLRVLRYQSKLGGVRDAKTWLAQIAWRVAVDRSKRRGREVPLEDSNEEPTEVASTEPLADDTVRGNQLETVLEKMIRALPDKLRQPLILSAIEEMSPREIAATLSINEAAVRSRVFRARQILKGKLAQRAGK